MEVTKSRFDHITIPEQVHSYTDEELEQLKEDYLRLKAKAESGLDLTLEEQRTIIRCCRADRETKFILNKSKPVKEKKVKEPKPPKEKKLKKLTKKDFNKLLLKELQGEELTEDEIKQRDLYLESVNIKEG